jgi:hypothetical protein
MTRTAASSTGWRAILPALPGIGVALLPHGFCPACWPAYTGILSALGLGVLLRDVYLLPVMVGLLALASLGWRASSRRGYGPFLLGSTASLLMLVAKFAVGSEPASYVGGAVLLAASIWNSLPHRAAPAGPCAECAPQAVRSLPSAQPSRE